MRSIRISPFFAAFSSRMWGVPHWAQIHYRRFGGIPPATMWPQLGSEQVRVVPVSSNTSADLPDRRATQSRMDLNRPSRERFFMARFVFFPSPASPWAGA